MDKLIIKKIIEFSFNKNKIKEINRELTTSSYNLFIKSINEFYKLRITNNLSVCKTPMIAITNKKVKNSKEIFVWCFNEFFYLSNSESVFISTDINTILKTIEENYQKDKS